MGPPNLRRLAVRRARAAVRRPGETGVSSAAREIYYEKLRAFARQYDFPLVDFAEHDSDPAFLDPARLPHQRQRLDLLQPRPRRVLSRCAAVGTFRLATEKRLVSTALRLLLVIIPKQATVDKQGGSGDVI